MALRGHVQVGAGIEPPRKVTDVPPIYPADAFAASIEGVVAIEITIGPDGKVEEAHVIRSVPALDRAALDAVRRWEFEPTVTHGKPVGAVMTVSVNFTLK